jgi:hypothetical protein
MKHQNKTVLMHQNNVILLLNLLKRTRTLLTDPDADMFTADQLLADINNVLVPQVQGTYNKGIWFGELEWTCPITGYIKNCTGEFNVDINGNHYHNIYNDNDQLLYVVIEGGKQ